MKTIKTKHNRILMCDEAEYELVKRYLQIFDSKDTFDLRDNCDKKTLWNLFEDYANSQDLHALIKLIVYIEREVQYK